MNKTVISWLVILYVAFLAGSASAATREAVTVKSGQKTLIYKYAVYLPTCGHLSYPVVKSRGNKHGKISSANGSFIANSGRCKGRRLRASEVYYQSEPGFRGTESIVVLFGFPKDADTDWGTEYRSVRFTIEVK